MGVSRADNSVKNWRNVHISNPKPDLHNISAHTKFGENPLMFTQVIILKRKTDGRTDGCMTDGLTDDQRETIIPHHYCVAGYKNTFSLEEGHLKLELHWASNSYHMLIKMLQYRHWLKEAAK